MAGDDGGYALVVMGCPFMEAFVYFIAEAGVGGGSGRVLCAEALEFCPEVMDKELANVGDFTAALRVCLVAVDQEDFIIQDDAFVDLHSREKLPIN